ncbi:MAG: type III-B CRISPR module-associated protein Cmr5, partial [Xanthomonadaceae bacterium]|nr:type III-B CRISPR module-associated protein Cmr5 [Xanthomonadaceae bacterium]
MNNNKPSAKPLRTNTQKQAQDAFDWVNTLVDDPLQQAYRSLARRVPALIRDCGLMQTLAFLRSKG